MGMIITVLLDNSKSKTVLYMVQIIIAFFMFAVTIYQNTNGITLLPKIKINKYKTIILMLIVSNIGIMAYGLYTSYDRGFAKEFIKLGESEKTLVTQYGKNKDYKKNILDIIQKDNSFWI